MAVTLTQLVAFVTVVRRGSVTAAAEELGSRLWAAATVHEAR